MDTSKIKNYEVTLRVKFLSNPLLYIMIFCAIFGIIIPFFKAIIPDGNVAIKDLTMLKDEIESIKKTYSDAEDTLKLMLYNVDHQKPIKLSTDKRETLKLLAYEKQRVFSVFFSFIAFLLQGGFFFALGLLLEHKFRLFQKIMPKNKVVSTNNDTSINGDDTSADVEFEEENQEETPENNQEKENEQEEFEEENAEYTNKEFEEEFEEKENTSTPEKE